MSDEGAETAVLWKQFSRYLKEVSKGKQAADSPTMFEKQLPYAAAFGLLHNWAKHFEEEGWTETPAYFHVPPTTTGDQAMVAFVTLAAVTVNLAIVGGMLLGARTISSVLGRAGSEAFSGNGRVAVVRFLRKGGPIPAISSRRLRDWLTAADSGDRSSGTRAAKSVSQVSITRK